MVVEEEIFNMKTTDTRQLRLMVDGILSAYGIDDLKLTIDLCEAFKKFYASPTPVKTREEILKGVENSLIKGGEKQKELDEIRGEIETRIHISPVGRDWEDFIEWAWKKKQSGQEIKKFLDWWVSDEWRLSHPPVNPQRWYIQWNIAFVSDEIKPLYKTLEINDEKAVPNPYKKPILPR